MHRFLVHWLTVAVALAITAWVLPGVHVASIPALAVAALVVGLANAVLRPVLFVLTLPLTIVTLGLFYLLLNGLLFSAAAALVPGFAIDSVLSAVLGAFLVGFVSWFIGGFIKHDKK